MLLDWILLDKNDVFKYLFTYYTDKQAISRLWTLFVTHNEEKMDGQVGIHLNESGFTELVFTL